MWWFVQLPSNFSFFLLRLRSYIFMLPCALLVCLFKKEIYIWITTFLQLDERSTSSQPDFVFSRCESTVTCPSWIIRGGRHHGNASSDTNVGRALWCWHTLIQHVAHVMNVPLIDQPFRFHQFSAGRIRPAPLEINKTTPKNATSTLQWTVFKPSRYCMVLAFPSHPTWFF